MTDMSEVPAAEPAVCAPTSDYVLNLRSYAPFKEFGGGFEGDNRGPSTSPQATSRIAVSLIFNPQSGKVGKPRATSSGTVYLPLNWRGMAEPRVTLVGVVGVTNGISLRLDLAGSNPLLKQIAPDIDLHTTMSFTLEYGYLRALAQLTGDRFPNAEMFVTDDRGQARMLMTYETTSGPLGGPAFWLPGNGKVQMNSICTYFPVDAGGRFI
jgi:hypothetical protein